MREYYIDYPYTKVDIGRERENEATVIYFDLSYFIETFGDGYGEIVFNQPDVEGSYPVSTTRDGNYLVWVVQESELQNAGYGSAELRWIVGDTIAKSAVFDTYNSHQLTIDGEAPSPVKDWVQKAQELIRDVQESVPDAINDALQEAKDSGEFKGERGEKGDPGIVIPSSGMYTMQIIGDNLHILYNNADDAPSLFIDDNGHLIFGERN